MTQSGAVPSLERDVASANRWIHELADELGTSDAHYAHRVLRAVLHAVRDRTSIDEGAQLAAQLPELIRGIFYEGWVPAHTPARYRDAHTFHEHVAHEALLHGDTEASLAAAATQRVLRRNVSGGELDQVLAVLPSPVRAALEPDAGA